MINDMDAVVVAVAHSQFAGMSITDFDKMYGEGQKILVDVKGMFSRNEYEVADYSYWRL